MCERQRLLNLIRTYDFALTEVSLYLDSHPNCPKALAYYQKHKKLHEEAVRLYNEQFGPLTNRQNSDATRWSWTDNPWPWEKEA